MSKPFTVLAIEPLEDRVVLTAGSWGDPLLPAMTQEDQAQVQKSKHTEWMYIDSIASSIDRSAYDAPQKFGVEEQREKGALLLPAIQAARGAYPDAPEYDFTSEQVSMTYEL